MQGSGGMNTEFQSGPVHFRPWRYCDALGVIVTESDYCVNQCEDTYCNQWRGSFEF